MKNKATGKGETKTAQGPVAAFAGVLGIMAAAGCDPSPGAGQESIEKKIEAACAAAAASMPEKPPGHAVAACAERAGHEFWRAGAAGEQGVAKATAYIDSGGFQRDVEAYFGVLQAWKRIPGQIENDIKFMEARDDSLPFRDSQITCKLDGILPARAPAEPPGDWDRAELYHGIFSIEARDPVSGDFRGFSCDPRDPPSGNELRDRVCELRRSVLSLRGMSAPMKEAFRRAVYDIEHPLCMKSRSDGETYCAPRSARPMDDVLDKFPLPHALGAFSPG